MTKHVFIVLTNPIDGQEDAYNNWYSNTHLADVLKIPGIVAAQRFKLSDVQRDAALPFRYLALYEVETDDLSSTLAELKKRAGTAAMVIPDVVAAERAGWFFQPITPRIEA